MIGIAGPSLLGGSQLLGEPLPDVALIFDEDSDWAFVDGGTTTPDAFTMLDPGGDVAADDVIDEGLENGIEGGPDPFVDVPGLQVPALVLDNEGDWVFENDGDTLPLGYAAIDGDGDPVVDNSVLDGLDIGVDVATDPYVEVP